MKHKAASTSAITSLGDAPDEERKARMMKYATSQGIRLVCIIACFFTPGVWLLIPALGAIFLPYFAVIAANQVTRTGGNQVERPGSILLSGQGPQS
ncbi:DUF3099 family protein [Microcella alkaliphila]|uniref:DUF3099 family protein n=1 Tax=Microcella alkaliphila TaxID=279828 RepID=A0A4Q7TSW6_9MICO|nr:DUF3099 domain-containing protein [Microcella alkaliphila]RZT64111.1 DUF3099 family protein [Microcella alkaliphila]